MLAWKEKVADRLARLLADSPVSPSPSQAAVEPSQVRSEICLYFPYLPLLLALALCGCQFGGWREDLDPTGRWDLGEDPCSRISWPNDRFFSSSTSHVVSYDEAPYLLFG
jgi:hypothetical protein